MDNKLMSSAVAETRLGVFSTIIAEQFENIDMSSICCYLFDVVGVQALPILANQLDVEGFKGYDKCKTEQEKRELLKSAIELHRYIGTKYAIKKACSLIGFIDSQTIIEENVPLITGGNNCWCAFRIRLNPQDLNIISEYNLSDLKYFISYYKPARSILTEIYFGIDLEDSIFTSQEEERDELIITSTLDVEGDYALDYSLDYY